LRARLATHLLPVNRNLAEGLRIGPRLLTCYAA